MNHIPNAKLRDKILSTKMLTAALLVILIICRQPEIPPTGSYSKTYAIVLQ